MEAVKSERTLQVLMLVAIAALGVVIGDSLRDRVVQAGDEAPDFSVVTEGGLTLTRSNFGGKVLVLNFWATWCAPCIQEIPMLNQLSEMYRDKGLVVLGVSVDKNPGNYRQFLERFNIQFATAHDPQAAISDSYGSYRYPETYIIDSDGTVVQKVIAVPNWTGPEMRAFLDNLLGS